MYDICLFTNVYLFTTIGYKNKQKKASIFFNPPLVDLTNTHFPSARAYQNPSDDEYWDPFYVYSVQPVLDITGFISEAFSSLFRKIHSENQETVRLDPKLVSSLHMYCHQENSLEECNRVFFKVFFHNVETVKL